MQMYEERCPFLHLVSSPSWVSSIANIEQWIPSINPPSKWREENFSLRCASSCREFCQITAHPRSKVSVRLRELEEKREGLLKFPRMPIDSRLSPRREEAPRLLLSTVLLSFLSFLLSFLLLFFFLLRGFSLRFEFGESREVERVFFFFFETEAASVSRGFVLWLSMVE